MLVAVPVQMKDRIDPAPDAGAVIVTVFMFVVMVIMAVIVSTVSMRIVGMFPVCVMMRIVALYMIGLAMGATGRMGGERRNTVMIVPVLMGRTML